MIQTNETAWPFLRGPPHHLFRVQCSGREREREREERGMCVFVTKGKKCFCVSNKCFLHFTHRSGVSREMMDRRFCVFVTKGNIICDNHKCEFVYGTPWPALKQREREGEKKKIFCVFCFDVKGTVLCLIPTNETAWPFLRGPGWKREKRVPNQNGTLLPFLHVTHRSGVSREIYPTHIFVYGTPWPALKQREWREEEDSVYIPIASLSNTTHIISTA